MPASGEAVDAPAEATHVGSQVVKPSIPRGDNVLDLSPGRIMLPDSVGEIGDLLFDRIVLFFGLLAISLDLVMQLTKAAIQFVVIIAAICLAVLMDINAYRANPPKPNPA